MLEWLQWAAVVPLLVALLLGVRGPVLLVALGFAVSAIGDAMSGALGNVWWVSYLWLPLQFSCILWALIPDRTERNRALAALLGLAFVASVIFNPGPEYVVSVLGSMLVLWTVRGWLAVPIYVYFGFGTLAYLWMVLRLTQGGDYMTAWWTYQTCRMVGLAACTGGIVYRGVYAWRWFKGVTKLP